jgi:hypothetical protein
MNTHAFRRRSYRNVNCGGAHFDFIPVFGERILELEAEQGRFAGEIRCRYRVSPGLEEKNVIFFAQRSSNGIPVGDMLMCAPGENHSGEFSIPGLEPGMEYLVIGAAGDIGNGSSGDVKEFVSDMAVAG